MGSGIIRRFGDVSKRICILFQGDGRTMGLYLGQRATMRGKTLGGIFALAALLVLFGVFFLDVRIARFVLGAVGSHVLLSDHVSNMPDILFDMVCVVTVLGWAGHLYLARRPGQGRKPDFFELLGSTLPIAFVLKYVLKLITGRANSRVWLVSPDLYGFHWFQGGGDFDGFPSGHMAVFTALMLGIARYFPRLRFACLGFLALLAMALIATGYHYFSDVVGGALLGLLVDQLTCRGLLSFHRPKQPADAT